MDIFRIENSVADLDSQVDQRSVSYIHLHLHAYLSSRSGAYTTLYCRLTPPNRRQTVGKSNDELASLEARIKEMEDRLRQSREKHTRPSISQITDPKDQKDTDSKARSRPGTARPTQQAPSSGNMPPTPGASEGEYYLVTNADLDDSPR